MGSHRIERTTEDIKRELTAIFRELKDPRVQQAFISIVRVEVTNDLSYCTVQISAIEGLDRAKEAVKGLKSASGFIRRAQTSSSSCSRTHFPRNRQHRIQCKHQPYSQQP